MRNRLVFLTGLIALLALVLLGCAMSRGSVSRTTPTPTKTPRPLFTATHTPTATPLPTDTLLPPTATPIPPTDMPLPTHTPQPTDTAVAPTEAPPTEALPTDTPPPAPTATAQPLDTPRPQATNTPVPPTNTPKPQVDFRVKEIVAFVDGSLGPTGLHNVYLTIVDAGGAPIDGIVIEEFNNEPRTQLVTGDKGAGKTEFLMWAADYRFRVVGNSSGSTFSSEETHVLSIVFGHAVWDDLIRGGVCASVEACQALGQSHYSYNVTFQRTW